MKYREIEQFKKKSIYSLQINNSLKESIVQSELVELNRVIKKEIKRKKLVVFLMECE
jgi:hypothetical protein